MAGSRRIPALLWLWKGHVWLLSFCCGLAECRRQSSCLSCLECLGVRRFRSACASVARVSLG